MASEVWEILGTVIQKRLFFHPWKETLGEADHHSIWLNTTYTGGGQNLALQTAPFTLF